MKKKKKRWYYQLTYFSLLQHHLSNQQLAQGIVEKVGKMRELLSAGTAVSTVLKATSPQLR